MTNMDVLVSNQIAAMYSENEYVNEYVSNIETEMFEEEKEQA